MTIEEWDAVMKVHLRGTFCPTRHAVEYWRNQTKAGEANDARVINTTSPSGIYGNVGQTNYGAAKAGIASFTIIAAKELGRYGVTVNAIAPRANTRMTEGLREWTKEELERRNPEWIAGLVTWLASSESKGISGRIFEVGGFGIAVVESWQHGPIADSSKDPTELGERMRKIVKFARANAGIDRDTWLDP
jgi:NAD(P)-dependent dehydrogenase (short-subunit alcohol dehydrogenase family)